MTVTQVSDWGEWCLSNYKTPPCDIPSPQTSMCSHGQWKAYRACSGSVAEQWQLNLSLGAHALSNKTHGASILHLWSLNFYYGHSNLPHQGEDMSRMVWADDESRGPRTRLTDHSGTKDSLPTSNPATGLSEPQGSSNVYHASSC